MDTSEAHVLNREISLLRFNERVLDQAEDHKIPLLERIKFLTIFHSNLDEFFMVRLSKLLRLIESQNEAAGKIEQLESDELQRTYGTVKNLANELVWRSTICLRDELFPRLKEHGIEIVTYDSLPSKEHTKLLKYFKERIYPILTPLSVDPAHPFPYISNLALYFAVQFEGSKSAKDINLAFLQLPNSLSRLIPVERDDQQSSQQKFILLEDLVGRHLDYIFPWAKIRTAQLFRITRNLDYQLLEGEVTDLMVSIESELRDRAQKMPVRLEVDPAIAPGILQKLKDDLGLDDADVYEVPGYLAINQFTQLLKCKVSKSMVYRPFSPKLPSEFKHPKCGDIFELIGKKPILLFHPYSSFSPVLEFLKQAANDPKVFAIKMTLYRTGGESPIVQHLVRAAQKGKQVTVLVELKARFDEENNIIWAKKLEEAGVHVVFGFVGLKTHAKCTLVVRQEKKGLKSYYHLSTGNYNNTTARFYTDFGYFGNDSRTSSDILKLFNLLTGFSHQQLRSKTLSAIKGLPNFKEISLAPFHMRDHFLRLVDREVQHFQEKSVGHIIMKMNSLTDTKMIGAFYRASQAGVKVDLIVRGACLLRPGVEGLSENIRVVSILDRFLEHPRIYWFHNLGNPSVWLSSADLMPRNLDRRIELTWQPHSKILKLYITRMLGMQLSDNASSYDMQGDGTYRKNAPQEGEAEVRCQDLSMQWAENGADISDNFFPKELDTSGINWSQIK